MSERTASLFLQFVFQISQFYRYKLFSWQQSLLLVPLEDGVITTEALYSVPFTDNLEECVISKIKCSTGYNDREAYQPILCKYDSTSLNSLTESFYYTNTKTTILPNFLEPSIFGPEGEICYNDKVLPLLFDNTKKQVVIRIVPDHLENKPSQEEFENFVNEVKKVLDLVKKFEPSLTPSIAYVPLSKVRRKKQPFHWFVERNLKFVNLDDLNSSELYKQVFDV